VYSSRRGLKAFREFEIDLQLVSAPFAVVIDELSEALQMELVEFQCLNSLPSSWTVKNCQSCLLTLAVLSQFLAPHTRASSCSASSNTLQSQQFAAAGIVIICSKYGVPQF
jgi:hypothetical protein